MIKKMKDNASFYILFHQNKDIPSTFHLNPLAFLSHKNSLDAKEKKKSRNQKRIFFSTKKKKKRKQF
jgi:hypothetical protein